LLTACSRPRPNLVLITLDTTRVDHLGAYGYERAETPNLDGLASEGFLFRRHLTPVPLTLPSHTTIMTGHYPPTHTVHDNGTFFVPQDELTLAEALHEVGYQTSAFVGSFPLESRFGLDQGFDTYDDDFYSGSRSRKKQSLDIFFDERRAVDVVEAAMAYHRERSAGPFFSFLHFFDPHQPQQPPAPFDLRFRDRPYDGEIAYVDEQLGRFFDFLRERGQWDNTIVIVTADHGEGLGEHGELTHAILLHQATLHVPLIVRGPGVEPGDTERWTISTQLFATVMDMLGVEAQASEVPRGSSLAPLLRGEQGPGGVFTAYFETIAPFTSQGWSQLVGFMKGDWRLIEGPRPQLFDLETDPGETSDRHGDETEIATSLYRDLRSFLDENQVETVGDSVASVDAETVERLAALGYLRADSKGASDLDDLLDFGDRLDPKDRVIDVSLTSEAKAAMARRQWSSAEVLWNKVLERTPENSYAHLGLAQLHGMTEDWERSMASLDRALENAPDSMAALRLKGEILVQTGEPQEGLDLLLELPLDSAQAATWIGKAYQALGQSAEAEAQFRKGLEADPTDRWLPLYLANQLASLGRLNEAESVYRALLAKEPYFQLAYYNFGRSLLDRGEPRRAISILERSASLAPGHVLTQEALREARTALEATAETVP
jgi:arylsulfatase A-like enzyme/Flp pilus assembly protein TadD